jgi:LPXTG-motif cell wall-anchored protein
MSRVSPLRLCSTAGLTLGVAAAGLAFAPAALAAEGDLPALTGGTTAVVGQPFTLSGVDCDALGEDPAFVYVDFYTKAAWDDPNGEPALSLKGNPKDGDWSATATFTSAATTGAYVAAAVCEPYADAFTFYPEFSFTLQAAPAAPTTPSATPSATPTVAPTGKVRGTSANTAGVASPDGGAATGDRTAPGQKVVKVLTGFKPGEVVTVTLHSAPRTVGTFTADASGTVRVEFTVPAGTPAGEHTLVYEGNMGTYFQEALTVAASGSGTGSGDNLAYTGASVAMPLGLGGGALALGGGLVFLTRRRNTQAAEASQA